MSPASRPWLLVGCLLGWASAGPRKKDVKEQEVLMPHHSFTPTLDFGTLLDDWRVSGASIFERERLLMHPGVAERSGFAYSNSPLLSNNFEVIFHFRVEGEKGSSPGVRKDQALAFWYTYESIAKLFNETAPITAKQWKDGLDEQGMTLVSSKATFQGVGVVLSMADPKHDNKPSVSGFTNDGHTMLSWMHDVPTPDAKSIDFRNTLNPAQVKIRVRPTSVEGWLKQSPSLSWNECFMLDRSKHPIKAGGYIGFSAWSGSQGEGATSDVVSITNVEVRNFDETSIGEEMKDVSKQIQETYMEMLTDKNRHFLDQKSQTEHLARLTELISQHINGTLPEEEKLFRDLQGYDDRMERLGEDCRTYLAGAKMFMNTNLQKHGQVHKDGVEAMKHEIIGLRRLLVKDSAAHRQKLEAVQKNVAEVKERSDKTGATEALGVIAKQTESLERTVKSRGNQMSWMMLCIMAAVIAIGVLMWNRMRYYEKKHFI